MEKITSLPQEDKEQINNIMSDYNDLRMTDGWHPGNKEENFMTMTKLADFTQSSFVGASVLDVGCGTGDLSAFLRQRGITKYLGIDLYKPSLQLAQFKYPEETFLILDLLSEELKGKFDFVVCSGGFTIKFKVNNYDFLESMVTKMWEHATRGIYFNFLTDDDSAPDPDLFFYNRDQLVSLCRSISPNAKIHSQQDTDKYQAHIFMYYA